MANRSPPEPESPDKRQGYAFNSDAEDEYYDEDNFDAQSPDNVGKTRNADWMITTSDLYATAQK